MEFKEMYDKHRKACEKLQALEDSIKRILTNIEYGKYSEIKPTAIPLALDDGFQCSHVQK